MKHLINAVILAMASASSFAQSNWHNDTVVPSGTFSSTFASSDIYNPAAKCTQIMINVASLTGQPAMEPHIQGKDQVTGNYYDILVGKVLTDLGENYLTVCQGSENVPNLVAGTMLPIYYRVQFVFKGTGSAIMSVESNYNN